MTDYTTQITQWYQAVQFRAPPAAELATYNAALNSGALNQAQIQSAIIADPYTTDFVNPVVREYEAAFGRVPDQAGQAYWVNVFASQTGALSNISDIFSSSAEFETRYGTTGPTEIANTAVLQALYENVLNRAPDAAGLAYWAGLGLTVSQALSTFSQSTEFMVDSAQAIVVYQQGEIAG